MTIKFDGKYFKDGSKIVGNWRNSKIYDGSGNSKALCNFRGGRVFEGSGNSKVLCNVRSGKVYEGSGNSKVLCKLSDAQKNIQGNMNEETLIATWCLFCT